MAFGENWSADTMVWVTDWGHAVHNNPSCPGIAAFGSRDKSAKVRLDHRLCAVRRACKKCIGEFYGVDSLRALDRLIEKLHGKVDFDQKAHTLIATTARLRFGDATARPPAKGRQSNPAVRSAASTVVASRGRGNPPKFSKPTDRRTKTPVPSKAEAKRRRDRAAAAKLGITVEQLKARRRAEQEARSEANLDSKS